MMIQLLLVTMFVIVAKAADWKCQNGEFQCTDGSDCIPAFMFCNGYYNCKDKSDEPPFRNSSDIHQKNATFCRNKSSYTICALPAHLTPYKEFFCDEDWQCHENEFPCGNGYQCIPARAFCDKYPNCWDETDEQTRDRSKIYDPGVSFYHNTGSQTCVVPAGHSALLLKKCETYKDGCKCEGQTPKHYLDKDCFRCLSHPNYVIPTSQLCDGIVDCPDLTDECLCPVRSRLKICEKLLFGGNTSQPNPYMKCLSRNNATSAPKEIIVRTEKICDARIDCLDAEDELGCAMNDSNTVKRIKAKWRDYKCMNQSKYATKCDGVPECFIFMPEECDCPVNEEFCKNFGVLEGFPTCDGGGGSSIALFGSEICNNEQNCADYADESGCSKTRFYCTADPMSGIPIRKKCDRHKDCLNGADEDGCPHFYCNDNGTVQYLQVTDACDGYQDCVSGRDECTNCVKSIFSSDDAMVKNPRVLAFVWIISLSASIGCIVVVVVTVRSLVHPKAKRKNPSNHTKLIRIMILSLSASDLLVATYTFAICAKALEFNHDYCKVDRWWRSGATCSALGALLVIGSEQSVFTMVLIAAMRLHSVMRPFAQPNIRLVTNILLTTWLISILFGVIPLIPSAEDYFVKSVLFYENDIFKIISLNETDYYFNWLGLMRYGSDIDVEYGNTDWAKLKTLVSAVSPNITVAFGYGYYASHTVCLPSLFPDTALQRDWQYTLVLLIINFLAFASMLVVYILLYKHATKIKAMCKSIDQPEKRQTQNARMQRKLTRIVASDFLCWMPICIMGFLQIIAPPSLGTSLFSSRAESGIRRTHTSIGRGEEHNGCSSYDLSMDTSVGELDPCALQRAQDVWF